METKKVTARLATGRKLEYVEGVDANGRRYEFVATLAAVGDQLHDVSFRPNEWNDIAASACAATKVFVTGELVVEDDDYEVYAGTDRAYKRGHIRNAEVSDIVDSPASEKMFARGARLPSAEALKKCCRATEPAKAPSYEEVDNA